jgi:amino-acid N-acetyltransferase
VTVTIRRATEQDEQAIRALAHKERVNPTGIHWPNFLVATEGDALIGAVQMRRHADGSRELGTLVVEEHARGRSVAAQLIDMLLAREQGRVYMITGAAHAGHYARWGFRPIDLVLAPGAIRRNYRIGSFGGGLISFFMRRPRRHLAVLERSPNAASKAAA